MQPEGVIVGGWNYVIAAYSISAVILLVYTSSLVLRLRKQTGKGSAS